MPDSAIPAETGDRQSNTGRKRTSKDAAATDILADNQSDQFILEALYPDPSEVFSEYSITNIRESDALIVLDTNTLLVPYHIKQDDLSALAEVYGRLAKVGRLILAARSAREFIKHRDLKLADMMKAMRDQKSRLQVPHKRLSPLLEGVDGYASLIDAQAKLVDSRKVYEDRLSLMIEELRSWRGNDPITALYRNLFSNKNIVEASGNFEDISKEWCYRRDNKIPPGYKDADKDDGGIGDYLIWKSILSIGSDRKKDLVFVTGDEKSDWYVRSNGEAIYPRPELVDEYRRSSGGKKFSLMSLAGLLSEMQVEADVVQDIRSAEEESKEPPKSVYTYPFTLSQLRKAIISVYGERERCSTSDLAEFRNEIIIEGFTSVNDVVRILSENKEEALREEELEHGGIYYTDIGIGRESFEARNPKFRNIIDKSAIYKRRFVQNGGAESASADSE